MNSIIKIEKYIESMTFDDFKKDVKTIDAVLRNLEIIGEAVKNLSNEIKNNYSEINWKAIAGMRDRLIHGYFGTDIEIIWKTIKNKILELEIKIKEILKNING
ncbi:MAG: HepT-like ribonuclease domain-containing protein [Candidatus Helarchaeota archaeon]